MTQLTPEQLAEIVARDEDYCDPLPELMGPAVRDRRALLSHVSALTAEIAHHQTEKIAILAEIAALRRDAERYRWLRTAGAWESEIGMDELSKDPAKFDAAIDSAMSPKILPEREG